MVDELQPSRPTWSMSGYAKQPEFAVGSFDGHVRLKNKNWFGQMKDEDVHDDEGTIEEIAWQPGALAVDVGLSNDCEHMRHQRRRP